MINGKARNNSRIRNRKSKNQKQRKHTTIEQFRDNLRKKNFCDRETCVGWCGHHNNYVDAIRIKCKEGFCLDCPRFCKLNPVKDNKKEGIEIMKKENEFVVKMAFKKMKLCINTKSCRVSFDNEKTWNWTSSNLLDEGTKVFVRDENDNIVQKEVKDITNIFWEGANYPILKED